jgi:hypothetical protein
MSERFPVASAGRNRYPGLLRAAAIATQVVAQAAGA